MRKLLLVVLAVGVIVTQGVAAATQANNKPSKVIYRYKNSEGVTVMDSKIPAEFVSKGYEVVSISGKVIEVVPPAPEGDVAKRLFEEKQLQEQREREDLLLRRSYSNVDDIEAAKQRNLESLRGNISILEANLTSAKQRLQGYQSQAAAIERTGRELPEDLLKSINNLTQEGKDIQVQIQQREQEYTEMSKKFDEDRKRFLEITQ
jgi:predicted  nucleic acid-binding Zn-ribbon protein